MGAREPRRARGRPVARRARARRRHRLRRPAFIAAYKSLIDDGFALPFGEGMALEDERSRAANAAVTPDAVEARRQAVQARRAGAIALVVTRPVRLAYRRARGEAGAMRFGWLVAALAMIVAGPARAAWLEATTRHFVLYADMNEAELREKAVAMERLDWALRRFMKVEDHADAGHNKVTVFWTGEGDFQSICRCPRSPVSTSRASPDRSPMRRAANSGQIVLFHEYAHHFLLENAAATLPFPTGFRKDRRIRLDDADQG
ncbi:hypothetical protein AB5I41_00790 [Sphingomonas sp. MMS24-JH45]